MKHIAKLFVISMVALTAGSLLGQDKSPVITASPVSIEHAQFVDAPQCSTGLVYDDGTWENGYGWNCGFGWGRWVMMMTPATYPYNINQICVALTRTAAGSATWTFNLVLFGGAPGVPNNDSMWSTSVTANNVPTWPSVGWFDFPVSGVPAISSGSVYVGISYDPCVNAGHFIGADQSATTPLRTGYGYIQSAWTTIQTFFPSYRALGIRVEGTGQTYAHDIGVGPFLSLPPWFLVNQTYAIKTRVSNFGTSNETGVPIRWFINNVLTNTTNINLNAGQSDSVSNNWTPTSAGSYTLKYVSALSGDQNPSNDTVQVVRQVYSTIPIPYYCNCAATTWTPITGGTPGPTGDDATMTVSIPFTFTYNATGYTQVSICTNGWVALGSTTSTTYTNDLCTTSGPDLNKLCPFWDDLNNTVNGISYTTLGTAPNRIFVVEYLHIPYFSGSGDVTFQVRLYENGNRIEFIYGPAVQNLSATGSVGLNYAPGGSGNVLSATPGNPCTATTWSTTSCNNSVPYNTTNLASGTVYAFVCVTGINPISSEVPNVYSLSQNYPNPFNPATIISYGIPKPGNVKLIVYDLLGREVATLVNEFQQAGRYKVDFDGSKLASGMYIYRIESGSFTDSKKMLLVK